MMKHVQENYFGRGSKQLLAVHKTLTVIQVSVIRLLVNGTDQERAVKWNRFCTHNRSFFRSLEHWCCCSREPFVSEGVWHQQWKLTVTSSEPCCCGFCKQPVTEWSRKVEEKDIEAFQLHSFFFQAWCHVFSSKCGGTFRRCPCLFPPEDFDL